MHRENLTHVNISKKFDYLITGSCDGHIKFWKKMLQGIEFVKHFQVCCMSLASFTLFRHI